MAAANFPEALAWLYQTQLFGIKLGLDSMHRLVAELKLPKQRFIHVAGTNGKGSTCAMIASIAKAGGLRTGLFTSPHLISFCERIQIDGSMISESDAAEGIEMLRVLVADWDPHPTFFELTTALALWYFSRHRTDLIVLETGMGGRLDATNVVTPLATVITPIALDHQQYLGSTLAKIAAEKAGIMKPGVPCVSSPQAADAAEVLQQHGEVKFITTPYTGSAIALQGSHQQMNAALAIAALEAAGFDFGQETITKGLHETTWPGRFQKHGDHIIIDGAHNPAGAAAIVETWKKTYPAVKANLIFGAVADKDVREVLKILLPIAAEVHCVTLNSPRAMKASELVKLIHELDSTKLVIASPDLKQELTSADSPTLVTGSLYLCGETLAILQGGSAFEPSAQ